MNNNIGKSVAPAVAKQDSIPNNYSKHTPVKKMVPQKKSISTTKSVESSNRRYDKPSPTSMDAVQNMEIDSPDIQEVASSSEAVNLEEIQHLRYEIDSLQSFIDDTMNTLLNVNDQLKLEQERSSELLLRAESAEAHFHQLTGESQLHHREIARLQQELRQLKIESSTRQKSEGDPLTIDVSEEVTSEKAVKFCQGLRRREMHVSTTRDDLLDSLRSLGESLCDTLVAVDEEEDRLLLRFPHVVFSHKPDSSPSAAAHAQQHHSSPPPQGFLFGKPSRRFDVLNQSISEAESEAEDDGDSEHGEEDVDE